jgi:hypothetical protein
MLANILTNLTQKGLSQSEKDLKLKRYNVFLAEFLFQSMRANDIFHNEQPIPGFYKLVNNVLVVPKITNFIVFE